MGNQRPDPSVTRTRAEDELPDRPVEARGCLLPAQLDTQGLDLPDEDLRTLLSVDRDAWREEAALIPAHFDTFGDQLPKELWDEYNALLDRMKISRPPPAGR